MSSTSGLKTFNEAHWDVLFAIFDAVVPAIVVQDEAPLLKRGDRLVVSTEEFNNLYESLKKQLINPPSRDLFREYLADRASQNALFVKIVRESVSRMPPRVSSQLRFILGLLGQVCNHFLPLCS